MDPIVLQLGKIKCLHWKIEFNNEIDKSLLITRRKMLRYQWGKGTTGPNSLCFDLIVMNVLVCYQQGEFECSSCWEGRERIDQCIGLHLKAIVTLSCLHFAKPGPICFELHTVISTGFQYARLFIRRRDKDRMEPFCWSKLALIKAQSVCYLQSSAYCRS